MKSRKKPLRREFGDSVQIGFPTDLHRDIFFYLMHWTWLQIFGIIGVLYIGGNLLFATLYWLQPGSISSTHPNSFVDCFFFSVQTMATIGYGVMSPTTLYAHILVTIEAAIGLMGVAMCTGVIFSRVSRPKAKVMFTEVFVINKRNGLPTLCFRVANARGNDLVEATVGVVMMVEEKTLEGHKMRRMLDIPLERNRSPFFRLSWTVMHTIDENSPLFAVNWDKPAGACLGFLITLMGYDGTYGQTVFARKFYYPDDLRLNHKFADVLSDMPDGRIKFDYSEFHKVVAE